MNATGRQLALEGMQLSYDAKSEEWKIATTDALYNTALALPYLTVEDVWKRVPDEYDKWEGNAMGMIMVQGRKNGWIEPTGKTVPGQKPTQHCKGVRLWHSRIYVPKSS
jgi:hypothetical protein